MPIKSKNEPLIGNMNYKNIPFVGINRHFVNNDRMRGFTFIEMMVTVIVVAILSMLAMPNLRAFVMNTRMTTQTNKLISDISLARSEAIKRGSRVLICSSSNGTTCTGSGWNSGRLLFWDVSPFAGVPTVDNIIRYTDPLPGTTVSGASTNFPDPLIFDSRGAPIDALGRSLSNTMAMPILFTLCETNNQYGGTQVGGRLVSLNVSGQATTNPFAC